jgi:hypothetical protein
MQREHPIVALTLAALGAANAGCVDPGGCPWTHASAVTIQPASPCLSVTLLNATGSGSYGGCVDPDLSVVNSCSSTLSVSSVYALTASGGLLEDQPGYDGGVGPTTVDISAGTTGAFEVNPPSGDPVVVNAQLGGAALELSFTLSK